VDRITIVGTGVIGTSLGMALKKSGIRAHIVGFDAQRGVADRAKKRGGVDEAVNNLPKALEDAKLVVLATPMMAMRDVLEFMAPLLGEGAVVTDVGGTKALVIEWAEKLLPSGISFVGGHPLVATEHTTPEAASETLFKDVLYPICPARGAHKDATRTVFDMVEAVGAKPYFMDPVEHDSYAAAVAHLPAVLSINLMACTSRSPAWREMHKMASASFRDISRLAADDPVNNLGLLQTNRENVLYWIDETIKQLYKTRTSLLEGDTPALQELLSHANDARARWIAGVAPVEEKKIEIPSAGQAMSQLFFGDLVSRQMQGGLRKDTKDGKGVKDGTTRKGDAKDKRV